MSESAVLDESISTTDPPPVPRLVDGTELIGRYHGSGYREPKYLVARGDGQIIQLPELLYELVAAVDGRRDVDALAARLRAVSGRRITADQVAQLLERKLRPAGIVAAPDGDPDGPAIPVAQPRPDPLLLLRFRVRIVPPEVVSRIAAVFMPLYWPPVVVALLAAFLTLDAVLVLTGAGGQVVAGVIALARDPALGLLVLGTVLVSGVFHEFGHAAACRYGGARPGPMGVGIYLVWPAYFSTVTDSYRLSRGGRLRVDLGGVYFNSIYIAGMGVAYLWTREAWLLVAILTLHMETARQFLPSIRLDGYYILSDLIGIPDLFMFLRPVLRSVVPGRAPDPKLAGLKPRIRVIIIAWVLLVVPFLLFFLAMFLVLAPQALPVAWDTMQTLLGTAAAAIRSGNTAEATSDVVRIFFLLLPIVGVGLLLGMIGRRIGRALVAPEQRAPALAARGTALRPYRAFLVAALPVSIAGLLAIGAADQLPMSPGEAVVVAGAGGPLGPVGGPDVAFVHQVAAIQGLLGDLVSNPIDAARTALVLANLVGCLLLYPVARRLGLSPRAAAVAVVLCGLPGPLVLFHASVDGGGPAAMWLAVAACLAGRGRAATAAAAAAVATAALTTPIAGAVVIVCGAHCVLNGQLAGRLRRWARQVGAGLLAAAALLAAVQSVGSGPWVTSGAGMPPADLRGGFLSIGALVLVAAWRWTPRLRPIVTGGAALLVLVVVPGPHVSTALLLALPVLALLVAALLETPGVLQPSWRRGVVVAGIVGVVVATSGPVVQAAAALPPDAGRLGSWIRGELEPVTAVQADPVIAAQLHRDGLSARLLPVTDAAVPGAVTVVATLPGEPAAVPPAGTRFLMAVPDGPGGAYLEVYGPDTGWDAAERLRLGSSLAGSPAVVVEGPAEESLRRGEVDLRLLRMLARLVPTHDLRIESFPVVEGEPATAPRRTVRIDAVDGVPPTTPGAAELVRRTAERSSEPPPDITVDHGALIVHYRVVVR